MLVSQETFSFNNACNNRMMQTMHLSRISNDMFVLGVQQAWLATPVQQTQQLRCSVYNELVENIQFRMSSQPRPSVAATTDHFEAEIWQMLKATSSSNLKNVNTQAHLQIFEPSTDPALKTMVDYTLIKLEVSEQAEAVQASSLRTRAGPCEPQCVMVILYHTELLQAHSNSNVESVPNICH